MEEITAYACDYCRKFYKSKSSAKRHEKTCYHNPNNRACLTCKHFDNKSLSEFGLPYCYKYQKRMQRFDFKYNCYKWDAIEVDKDSQRSD